MVDLTANITVTISITDVQEVVTPEPPTTNVAPEFMEGDSTTRCCAGEYACR